jgi:hypothetical protein
VVLGSYVLRDQTDAWLLRIPYIKVPNIRLIPSLTARFRSISGPHRMGLPSARNAARELGVSVFETGVTLALDFINLLTAGQPIDHPDSWIDAGQ